MAARIGLTIMILLFLSTAAIFASEEERAYDGTSERTSERVYEKVIAHGGGAYRGYDTTNSVEALNQAIANGYKIIELDMELSTDHKIIMLHDWDRTAEHYYGAIFPNKLSKSSFLNLSVHGQFEVLTFDKLAAIMKRNPDIRIVSDTKGDNEELLTVIRNDYPDLADRIIPQIYDYDEYQTAFDLGYRDVIFTLYKQETVDIGRLAGFVSEHGIYAVAMPDYFAEKGLLSELARRGVPVYVHPVDTYEKALAFQQQGACGVYSGTLMPDELAGLEKNYFLAAAVGDGSLVKLTDQAFREEAELRRELRVKGLAEGESAVYFVDSDPDAVSLGELFDLPDGKHRLTVELRRREGTSLGRLDYFLWKNEDGVRLLHKKYEYRLDDEKGSQDFNGVMELSKASAEVCSILEGSLIARRGEALYYNNGSAGTFRNRDETFSPRQNFYGKLLVPLSTTLLELGADSVTMEKGNDIVISYENQKYRSVAGTSLLRGFIRSIRLSTPVTLYLNKAMAGGEFCENITGRPYIENGDMIVILPAAAMLKEGMRAELFRAAALLFHDTRLNENGLTGQS
jgi:glycerophosphoryl diester phosphodiesterase